jgi:hypothetical protein
VDVPARRIHLEVSDAELAARRAAWVPPPPRLRARLRLDVQPAHLQADQGCDFDYLETSFGAPVPSPSSTDGRPLAEHRRAASLPQPENHETDHPNPDTPS